MKTVYKCEKCGLVFDDYTEAEKHESNHYTVKTWTDDADDKVISRETEYISELFVPAAVVVPMTRCRYDEDTQEWKTETAYIKYYYSAKKPAEQVFPVDESLMK